MIDILNNLSLIDGYIKNTSIFENFYNQFGKNKILIPVDSITNAINDKKTLSLLTSNDFLHFTKSLVNDNGSNQLNIFIEHLLQEKNNVKEIENLFTFFNSSNKSIYCFNKKKYLKNAYFFSIEEFASQRIENIDTFVNHENIISLTMASEFCEIPIEMRNSYSLLFRLNDLGLLPFTHSFTKKLLEYNLDKTFINAIETQKGRNTITAFLQILNDKK
jgi:hypothetical protein